MSPNLPEGYTAHDGGECPVDLNQFVDVIVRTTEGLGHSGIMRARYQEWDASKHQDGIGAVVGYRTATPGDADIDLQARWPENA